MSKLSVVINTKNAAKTFKSCLESVRFADEIVVVDMHSADETQSIARAYTNQVFEYEDVGWVEPARNWAIEQATHDWILIVDADEEVPETLQAEIVRIIQSEDAAQVYRLPRKNIIFNQWIEGAGWWPDYQVRLFQKGAVSWKDKIHSIPEIRGRVEDLRADERFSLIHHNHQTVEGYIDRLNRYTSVEAAKSLEIDDFNSKQLMSIFSSDFFERGFAQKGIDLGLHGTALSLLQSFYQAVVYLKIWQKAGFKQTHDAQDLITALGQFQKDLNYWVADYQVGQSQGLKKFYWQLRRKFKI